MLTASPYFDRRADPTIAAFIETVNTQYEEVHLKFENQFWGTKMGLGGEFTSKSLTETKTAMEQFLQDPARYAEAQRLAATGAADPEQAKTLEMFCRTFGCYQMPNKTASDLRAETTAAESALEGKRNVMKLGYTDPESGAFVAMSSVGLRARLKSEDSEPSRKAAYAGLRSIGDAILADGFPDIVRKRNKLARTLGYIDFYDYKVTQAEGFGKKRLFEILDSLETRTRPLMVAARAKLAAESGESALEGHNLSHATAGDVTKLLDPYFPFERAVEMWGRSFAALGIKYRSAVMTLDLLDRPGKYSNGFCHWPQPAWRKPDGSWQPSQANFTSLADPAAVGSGQTALTTLMHEAGHAAHFANIVQPSPLFAQERAPTSVAYAENQSMFLDSLVDDARWLGRYARNRAGEPIPWDLIEARINTTRPYNIFSLRAMLNVPYFEKALYELDDADVTPERIQKLADEMETKIFGGLSPRPLLSVPHIISDEASCYYHGYVLAEMSVHQTRAHFLGKYGTIVDNPKVGDDLTNVYWSPGNSKSFLDLVNELTGSPLSGDAWVAELEKPIEQVLAEEHADYGKAVALPSPLAGGAVDLGIHIHIVDGNTVIAESGSSEGSRKDFLQVCREFESFVKINHKL